MSPAIPQAVFATGAAAIATLQALSACPLCADTSTDARSTPYRNLYSEQLSLQLHCDESALLGALQNVRCAACGLWYKTRWFAPVVLRGLFSRRVPEHPKGWDAVSDRFSPAGFASAVDDLSAAIKAPCDSNHDLRCARSRRALVSIIDCMQDIDIIVDDAQGGVSLRKHLLMAVAEGNVAALIKLSPLLETRLQHPAPFKRFSGFSSPLLWDWLVSHLGPLHHYGEIGCPLWGQLNRSRPAGVTRSYFRRDVANYWGDGCRREGQHCSERLAESGGVSIAAWPPSAAKLDLLGAFQYLDHLEAPGEFLAEVFEHSRALLLVFDDGAEASAIQHATGWGARPIAWLARRHGKRVVDDFDAMSGSGNRAWLLCDV